MAAEASSDLVVIVGAACTLLGAIATGLFSNWEKIFHRDRVIEAKVSGYRASGDIRQEIGILLERTGVRQQIDDLQARLFAQQEAQLRQQLMPDGGSVEDEAVFERMTAIVREETPDFDDLRKVLVPIWEKYYTLSAIEELNKFNSTDTMRDFQSKAKLVMEEFWPQLQVMAAKIDARIQMRLRQEFPPPTDDAPQLQ